MSFINLYVSHIISTSYLLNPRLFDNTKQLGDLEEVETFLLNLFGIRELQIRTIEILPFKQED